MTDTDIPCLIERGRKHADIHDAWDKFELGMEVPPPLHRGATAVCLREMVEALSRLFASPLPGEIAALIEEVLSPRCADHEDRAKRVAAALEQMARENQALAGRLAALIGLEEERDALIDLVKVAQGKAEDLEAERDRAKAKLAKYFGQLKVEADAIRAKTIAEFQAILKELPYAESATSIWIKEKLRALKPEAGEGGK